jgi:putative endonuclease
MPHERTRLGSAGEELAAQFLVKKGYEILARNLKTKYGEVDLLALDHQTLVIVEVKMKRDSSFGPAVAMITAAKQRKLRLLAQVVASQRHMVEYRIDVVAIDVDSRGQSHLEHYVAAL